MIVGTRMLNGKIAHFQVEGSDYKNARNEVMWELGVECGVNTPILALIPDCGRDIKPTVAAHRVTLKDPLAGALSILTREIVPEAVEASGKPVTGLVDQVDE